MSLKLFQKRDCRLYLEAERVTTDIFGLAEHLSQDNILIGNNNLHIEI